ncbi:MAG: hypothetical protein ACI8Q2_000170, partial [Candidatus Omnitrophota bacterium]
QPIVQAQSAPAFPIAQALTLTQPYHPVIIKGLTVYPDNPFQFNFIVDTGDEDLQGEALETESMKLIKYFLTSLTVPEGELWVNLSPYEKDRIIPKALSQTEMGRDLLGQDYILKQLTASLLSPNNEAGKKFWNKIYKNLSKAAPIDIFHKIWIVPERSVVHVNGHNVFVVESYLKVMIEEDYLALEESSGETGLDQGDQRATVLMREAIIPAIEKEVNEGKHFAQLRQVFNALILATWYKKNLKTSIINKIYSDKQNTNGIETQNRQEYLEIYNDYIEGFKAGVYDLIKEDYDPASQMIQSRKYFTGGVDAAVIEETIVESKSSDFRLLKSRGNLKNVKWGTDAASLENASQFDSEEGRILQEKFLPHMAFDRAKNIVERSLEHAARNEEDSRLGAVKAWRGIQQSFKILMLLRRIGEGADDARKVFEDFGRRVKDLWVAKKWSKFFHPASAPIAHFYQRPDMFLTNYERREIFRNAMDNDSLTEMGSLFGSGVGIVAHLGAIGTHPEVLDLSRDITLEDAQRIGFETFQMKSNSEEWLVDIDNDVRRMKTKKMMALYMRVKDDEIFKSTVVMKAGDNVVTAYDALLWSLAMMIHPIIHDPTFLYIKSDDQNAAISEEDVREHIHQTLGDDMTAIRNDNVRSMFKTIPEKSDQRNLLVNIHERLEALRVLGVVDPRVLVSHNEPQDLLDAFYSEETALDKVVTLNGAEITEYHPVYTLMVSMVSIGIRKGGASNEFALKGTEAKGIFGELFKILDLKPLEEELQSKYAKAEKVDYFIAPVMEENQILRVGTAMYRFGIDLGIESFDVDGVLYPAEQVNNVRLASQQKVLLNYPDTDAAILTGISPEVGGIDFNPEHLDLDTQGMGIQFNVDIPLAIIERIKKEGIQPRIFQITPVTNLPLLLGIKEEDDVEQLSYINN